MNHAVRARQCSDAVASTFSLLCACCERRSFRTVTAVSAVCIEIVMLHFTHILCSQVMIFERLVRLSLLVGIGQANSCCFCLFTPRFSGIVYLRY